MERMGSRDGGRERGADGEEGAVLEGGRSRRPVV
jgi:hypothetical protein